MLGPFRLIGCTALFVAVRFYMAAGFIPSVVGVGTYKGVFSRTCARLADIEWIADHAQSHIGPRFGNEDSTC